MIKYAIHVGLLSLALLIGACSQGEGPKQDAAAQTAAEKATDTQPGAAPDAAAQTAQAASPGAEGAQPANNNGNTMEQPQEPAAALTEKDLLHRRFTLKTMNGKDYSQKERVPDLEFLEGFRVSGGWCNRFSGLGKLADGVLSADKMVSTKMMCVDEDMNRMDFLFPQMLQKGARIRLENNVLTISGDDLELVYEASDWKQ